MSAMSLVKVVGGLDLQDGLIELVTSYDRDLMAVSFHRSSSRSKYERSVTWEGVERCDISDYEFSSMI